MRGYSRSPGSHSSDAAEFIFQRKSGGGWEVGGGGTLLYCVTPHPAAASDP